MTKMMTWTKTFNNENEVREFMDTHVGTDKYYKVREQNVTIDKLTVKVRMMVTRYYWHRARTLEQNGFSFVGRV